MKTTQELAKYYLSQAELAANVAALEAISGCVDDAEMVASIIAKRDRVIAYLRAEARNSETVVSRSLIDD